MEKIELFRFYQRKHKNGTKLREVYPVRPQAKILGLKRFFILMKTDKGDRIGWRGNGCIRDADALMDVDGKHRP